MKDAAEEMLRQINFKAILKRHNEKNDQRRVFLDFIYNFVVPYYERLSVQQKVDLGLFVVDYGYDKISGQVIKLVRPYVLECIIEDLDYMQFFMANDSQPDIFKNLMLKTETTIDLEKILATGKQHNSYDKDKMAELFVNIIENMPPENILQLKI